MVHFFNAFNVVALMGPRWREILALKKGTALKVFEKLNLLFKEAFDEGIKKRGELSGWNEMKVKLYRDLGVLINVFNYIEVKSQRSQCLNDFEL